MTRTEYVAWLENELVSIAETIAPRKHEESQIDYAIMVSSLRHIFEADLERYDPMVTRVHARRAKENRPSKAGEVR